MFDRVLDQHLAAVLEGSDFLLFDGAMGTQLQERGLAAGELPELLCLSNPQEVTEIHAAYVAAGADYLVVGRPITRAADPLAAAHAILDEMHTC